MLGLTTLKDTGQSQAKILLNDSQSEHILHFEHLLKVKREPILVIAQQYEYFINSKQPELAQHILKSAISNNIIEEAWILDERFNKKQVHQKVNSQLLNHTIQWELAAANATNLEFFPFHSLVNSQPVEVIFKNIKTIDGNNEFIALVKQWNTSYIQQLSNDIGSLVELAPTNFNKKTHNREKSFYRSFKTESGENAFTLLVESEHGAYHGANETWDAVIIFGILLSISGTILISCFLFIWLVKPLRDISNALDSGDAKELGDLTEKNTELGHLARLVERFFDQKTRFLAEIVERRKAEEESALAKEEAIRASALKSEFLANLSHEIRTPLNGVVGMAELLLTTPLTPDQRKYITTIEDCADSLISMLNEILDCSKIEAGKMELTIDSYDLKKLTKSILSLFSWKANSKNIDLILNWDADVPDHVMGDSARMRQILSNLIANAIKFTEKGFVKVSAQKVPSPNGDLLKISVEDTGIGIPENRQVAIFESFTQADGSTSRRFGGTGLGLSICKKLINMMGGSISLNSIEGKGSTFTIQIPLIPAQVENSQEEAIQIFRLQTLIVDDNPVNQKVAKKLLEHLECNVLTASSGKEAISLLKSKTVDVVFMDVQMPEIDGIETTKTIRNTPGFESKPIIIAMTANSSEEQSRLCYDAGMNDYITKPITIERVSEVLSCWFKENVAA